MHACTTHTDPGLTSCQLRLDRPSQSTNIGSAHIPFPWPYVSACTPFAHMYVCSYTSKFMKSVIRTDPHACHVPRVYVYTIQISASPHIYIHTCTYTTIYKYTYIHISHHLYHVGIRYCDLQNKWEFSTVFNG